MDKYIIVLVWVMIITSLGIYWHTMKINKNVQKIVEFLSSKENSGS